MTKSKSAFWAGVALSALITASATASDSGARASRAGTREGANGTPVGSQNCLFSYAIQKIGDDVGRSGEKGQYLVTVKNIGNCDLKRVSIQDVLPRLSKFDSAFPAPTSVEDRKLRWDDLEIDRGKFVSFLINVRFDKDDHSDGNGVGVVVTNTACTFSPYIGVRICDVANTLVF